MSAILHPRVIEEPDGTKQQTYWWWCPGCAEYSDALARHHFDKRWGFNGDEDKPTFDGSYLVQGGSENMRCHSFVKNGRVEYLSDCTHSLAGKTIDMVPLPEWCP